MKKANAILAEYELWASDLTKNAAKNTHDPQLKEKFEQISAINKLFYEKFNKENEKKEKDETAEELKMLINSYFCHKAVLDALSIYMPLPDRPSDTDEAFDREAAFCREIIDEMTIRIKTENE